MASRAIQNVRKEVNEIGFDVFISCKSQDYELAHELKAYLDAHGFKPFLADMSLREACIDQYTAVIGEVLDRCKCLIVFTTKAEYLETNYVYEEWSSFVNSINSGFKSDSQIFNIIAPTINVSDLPYLLRNRQCFYIDNYQNSILHYLNGIRYRQQ